MASNNNNNQRRHPSELTPLLFKSQLTESLTLSDRTVSSGEDDDEKDSSPLLTKDNGVRKTKAKAKTKTKTRQTGPTTIPWTLIATIVIIVVVLVAVTVSPVHDNNGDATTGTNNPNPTVRRPVQPHVVVPGNAEWLGKGEMVDDAPVDFESYLPLLYVIMGPQAMAIPRIILPLTTRECPQLVILNATDTDANSNNKIKIPPVTLRGLGDMKLPHAFPIRICETRLETKSHKDAWNRGILAFEGLSSLPQIQIPTDPKKVVVLGDTGLRTKLSDFGLGKCTGPSVYGVPQCNQNFTAADLLNNRKKNTSQPIADGSFQGLDDWPLPDIMQSVKDTNPDLVIHLGDYIYRQSPCPANNTQHADCAAINLPANFATAAAAATATGTTNNDDGTIINFVPGHWGDNWFGWWADFFFPALEVLQTTPMIAIRGNHENCERGGHGYFFLLSHLPYNNNNDPSSNKQHLGGGGGGGAGGSWCLDYVPPFAVPFEQEQFLVMDDSIIEPKLGGIDAMNFTEGACPGPPQDGTSVLIPKQQSRWEDPTQTPKDIETQVATFKQYMEDIKILSHAHNTNFYLSHRPIAAVACNGDEMNVMDWTMQQSLQLDTMDRVVAMFAGHMHWLQVLSFVNQTLPTQLVVGHGGTKRIPNYVNQSIFSSLELHVGPATTTTTNGGTTKEHNAVGVGSSSSTLFQARVDKGMTDSTMYGFAVMKRDATSGDYNVKFLSLNHTTSTMIQNDKNDHQHVRRRVVELGYHVTIPKRPPVAARESS